MTMSLTPLYITYYIGTNTYEIAFEPSLEGEEPRKATFPPGRTTGCVDGAYYNSRGQRIALPYDISEVVEFYGSSGPNNDMYIVRRANSELAIACPIPAQEEPKCVFAPYSGPVVNSRIFKEAFLGGKEPEPGQNPMIFYKMSTELGRPSEATVVCPSCFNFGSPHPWADSLIFDVPREEVLGASSDSLDSLSHILGPRFLCDKLTVSSDGTKMFACANRFIKKFLVATDLEFLKFVRTRYSIPTCCWYRMS